MPASLLIIALQAFVFIYPIAMGVLWTVSGILFWWQKERRPKLRTSLPDALPAVTVLVPCYNEAETIVSTCENLLALDYPVYRVVFINDGSSDDG